MASFTFNPKSTDSELNQYKKHLREQNYINKVFQSGRAKRKGNDVYSGMHAVDADNMVFYKTDTAEEEETELTESVNAIRSALEDGFADIKGNLYEIKDGIRGLSTMVGHGFSLIVEAQKFVQQYLMDIQGLLRTLPEDQKQKTYYIERGMMFLQNAFLQDAESDFYSEALEEFKKAEAIEKKDPFTLYLVGLIHLSSIKNLDPSTAEGYFRRAARYYRAEVSVDKTNYSYSLLKSKQEYLLEITKVLLFAAKACYIQQKFAQAAQLAEEAWATFPENLKAGFFQSKYLAANQQTKEAAQILEKIIDKDPLFSLDVFEDMDLIMKTEITGLLDKLREEGTKEAKEKLNHCLQVMLPDSIAKEQTDIIAGLMKSGTLIETRKALDLLNAPQHWLIEQGAGINDNKEVEPKIYAQEFNGSLVEFVDFERERVLAIPRAKILIELEKKELQLSDITFAISTRQTHMQENITLLKRQWKYWLVSFGVTGMITLFGIGIKNSSGNLVGSAFEAICNIVTYAGGLGLILALLFLILKSTLNSIERAVSKAEIRKNEERTVDLKYFIEQNKPV